MINVDDVYQKVLALANKEQRGYITPQDFNLFANQAQMEIFEQYFYDINSARKNQGNDTVYADVDDMLEEKIQIFEEDEILPSGNWSPIYSGQTITGNTIPDYVWRIHRIELQRVDCEILNTKDFNNVRVAGRLLKPSNLRPIANVRNNVIRVVGDGNDIISPTSVYYFRIPTSVNWTYVVINKKAMYDANATTMNFELHSSEENQLINKILRLAGISNKQQDIMSAGQGMDMMTTQLQPKI